MKLFLFCDSLSQGKGGAERVFTNLATEMRQRGHNVCVGFDGSAEPSYQQSPGIKLVPWVRDKYWISNTDIKHYQAKIIEEAPDLFFGFYFSRQLLKICQVISQISLPFGMQECTNPEYIRYQTWKNTTGRKMFAAWEREVAASSATRIRMVMPGYENSFPPYIRQNVRAFPNSIPETQLRANFSGNDKIPKRIIIVGGGKKNKNITLLIKAFSRLQNEFPEWEVHSYGASLKKGNEYHQMIQHLVSSCQLEGKVVFHPPTDDIFLEFAKSHIHVISSMSEGCPTCVLEAMAHGLPSVGINSCPGTNKLIRHNKNGLLVGNDITGDELAVALSKIMGSSSLQEKLGQQAFLDAKNFQHTVTYDKWEELFYEMAAYKDDPERLLKEQVVVDKERALHMARCRRRIFNQEK